MKAILMTLLFSFLVAAPTKTVYDFKLKNIDGKDVNLSEYKGKVIVMVNVASYCGYTSQYKDLEAIYQKYKSKGLVVLGFPANNFMAQEPGTDADIKQFCSREYAVTFPMFSKISVKGKDIHPLYAYLTNKSENGVVDGGVQWNFQKYLIGKDGKVIASFKPGTKVTEAEVIKAIETALN